MGQFFRFVVVQHVADIVHDMGFGVRNVLQPLGKLFLSELVLPPGLQAVLFGTHKQGGRCDALIDGDGLFSAEQLAADELVRGMPP